MEREEVAVHGLERVGQRADQKLDDGHERLAVLRLEQPAAAETRG